MKILRQDSKSIVLFFSKQAKIVTIQLDNILIEKEYSDIAINGINIRMDNSREATATINKIAKLLETNQTEKTTI